jgi:drug/metabolite transporter (DMT)-like permease
LTREPPHKLLYVLIALMVLCWAANYTVGKVVLREFPAVLLGCLRIILAALFIAPLYAWQQNGRSWLNSDWRFLIVLGVFGVTLNQLFFVLGLSRTSVVHSVLIIAMTPIFVLMIAASIKQERITVRKAAGMLIAISGVAILNALPSSEPPGRGPTLLGDFLVFLAASTFALFTVFGKHVSSRHSSITVNTFAYVSGALALTPLALWFGRDFPFGRVSMLGWISLAYMAFFPSVVCYLIYYYALTYIPASRVAAFNYLQPVLATLMAVVALGERVTWPLVAGGAVIFSGVYLTERA